MEKAKDMQFAKRSLLLIVGSSVKIAVQLLVLYIFSRKLDVHLYGKYQSIWLYLNVLTVVGLFGLPAIILSSSPTVIKKWITNNLRSFALYAFLLNIIPLVFLLLTAADFTWPERIMLCLLIALQTTTVIAETLAIKNEKESRVLAVNLFYNAAFLALHLLIVSRDTFSVLQLMIGLICLNMLKIILLSTKRNVGTELIEPTVSPGKQWLYLGLNDITGVVFKWIDKWLILAFISIEQFAFYYNGSYEIPVFALLLTAAGNIMLVELSKVGQAKTADIVSLFHRSACFLAAFIFPAFCCLGWFHREIFLVLFSDKYAAAIPIFLVSIFVIPVRITNYTAALQVYHRNDIILKGSLLDLFVAIVLMLLLYPLFKLPGLAAAFVVSTYIQAYYYLWHTGKLLNISPLKLLPFRQLLQILLFCILLVGGCYFLVTIFHSSIVSLTGGTLVSSGLVIFILYRLYKTKRL